MRVIRILFSQKGILFSRKLIFLREFLIEKIEF